MIREDKKEQCLTHLTRCILSPEMWSPDKFRVIGIEAGVGKSVTAKEAIAKLALRGERIVYVQPFVNKDKIIKDGAEIQETVDTINVHAGIRFAVGLTSGTSKSEIAKLKQYDVLVISTAMYKSMCQESNSILDAYSILIIDEFPNLYESYGIDLQLLSEIERIRTFYPELAEDVEKVIGAFRSELEYYETKFGKDMRIVNLKNKPAIRNTYNRLNKLIKLANARSTKLDSIIRSALRKLLNSVTGSCVYTNRFQPTIHSFYKDYKFKLLDKNNIILDAGASVDYRYRLNPSLFNVDIAERVYDYSTSVLNLYPNKTTATMNAKTVSISAQIAQRLMSSKRVGRKSLIIADKQSNSGFDELFLALCEAFRIDFAHFGSLVGKNDWSECNDVWLLKTHFLPHEQYFLMYMYYSGREMHGSTSCKVITKGNRSKFEKEDVEKLKRSLLLCDWYQALKRAGRRSVDSCTINILTVEQPVVRLLRDQLDGIQYVEYDALELEMKKKEKSVRARPKTEERIGKVIDLLSSRMQSGNDHILKSEIVEHCGVKKKKLSTLLKQDKVAEFMLKNQIVVGKGREQDKILLPQQAT